MHIKVFPTSSNYTDQVPTIASCEEVDGIALAQLVIVSTYFPGLYQALTFYLQENGYLQQLTFVQTA